MISTRNYTGRRSPKQSKGINAFRGTKKATAVTLAVIVFITIGIVWGGVKLTKHIIAKRKAAKAVKVAESSNLQAA